MPTRAVAALPFVAFGLYALVAIKSAWLCDDVFITLRTVDNFIVRLRRLLEPDPKNPRYLHTVRGAGYRLTP